MSDPGSMDRYLVTLDKQYTAAEGYNRQDSEDALRAVPGVEVYRAYQIGRLVVFGIQCGEQSLPQVNMADNYIQR